MQQAADLRSPRPREKKAIFLQAGQLTQPRLVATQASTAVWTDKGSICTQNNGSFGVAHGSILPHYRYCPQLLTLHRSDPCSSRPNAMLSLLHNQRRYINIGSPKFAKKADEIEPHRVHDKRADPPIPTPPLHPPVPSLPSVDGPPYIPLPDTCSKPSVSLVPTRPDLFDITRILSSFIRTTTHDTRDSPLSPHF